ncbi:MAG: hypothetical protein KatS3mg111_4040 [Pirellulaceae bacterium]|nr:MAG: hypothetical protein KatS3mg111_4040 [Pirellulaceae bacterium]
MWRCSAFIGALLLFGCSGNSEPTLPETVVDEEPNLEIMSGDATGDGSNQDGAAAAPLRQR